MNRELAESYVYCRRVARSRARNFYYSFKLLDRDRRNAMCALYAFNRRCDDLSDEPERSRETGARAAIESWRGELVRALDGSYGESALWPAFHDSVQRYGIPREYFYEMIEGVVSDLEPHPLTSFEDLYRYCYRVASTVGLSVLSVFGFESDEAPVLAEKCGIAFQLTNIFRDVREDARMGRVYLPEEDLRRFGVSADQLRDGVATPEFVRLMQFEANRARSYYDESARLADLVNPKSRPSLRVLVGIYSRLLERIEEAGFDVLSRRIRVPAREKWWILLRGLVGG